MAYVDTTPPSRTPNLRAQMRSVESADTQRQVLCPDLAKLGYQWSPFFLLWRAHHRAFRAECVTGQADVESTGFSWLWRSGQAKYRAPYTALLRTSPRDLLNNLRRASFCSTAKALRTRIRVTSGRTIVSEVLQSVYIGYIDLVSAHVRRGLLDVVP